MKLKRTRQPRWLIVVFGVLLTGCTAGQSAQPAATETEVPSTGQVSTVVTATALPTSVADSAPASAIPAVSPVAATPMAEATPVASAATAVAATPVTGAATPIASTEPEVIILRLGRAASELSPGNDLVLHTITFQPGSSLRPHAHPGETIFHLETGTLAFTLVEGEARLVRGTNAIPSVATPTATDAVPLGVEIEVNAGDTLYYDASAVQTERNPGTEDAVAIVINVRGAQEPRVVPVGEDPTPTVTPVSGGTP